MRRMLMTGQSDEDELAPWMAQYVVMKRVAIENNFHRLYSQMIVNFEWPALETHVLKETCRCSSQLICAHTHISTVHLSDALA